MSNKINSCDLNNLNYIYNTFVYPIPCSCVFFKHVAFLSDTRKGVANFAIKRTWTVNSEHARERFWAVILADECSALHCIVLQYTALNKVLHNTAMYCFARYNSLGSTEEWVWLHNLQCHCQWARWEQSGPLVFYYFDIIWQACGLLHEESLANALWNAKLTERIVLNPLVHILSKNCCKIYACLIKICIIHCIISYPYRTAVEVLLLFLLLLCHAKGTPTAWAKGERAIKGHKERSQEARKTSS